MTDIVSPMYPELSIVKGWAETNEDSRPFISCEYSHSMGNSHGIMEEYWKLFEAYENLQGGFVWEWCDHAIRQFDETGREYWAYGGDFRDMPNDANFCVSGLVGADRLLHPGMVELKKLAQPIAVKELDRKTGRVSIKNKYHFISLDWLTCSWCTKVEGQVIQSGQLDISDMGPGECVDFDINLKPLTLHTGEETFLFLEFTVTDPCPWANAGHLIAWEQIKLDRAAGKALALPGNRSSASQCVKRDDGQVEIQAGEVEIMIDPVTGRISHYTCGSVQLLSSPELNIFRAYVDNDGLKIWDDNAPNKIINHWRALGIECSKVKVLEAGFSKNENDEFFITTESTVMANGERLGVDLHQTMLLLSDGTMEITCDFKVDERAADLPRLGLIFSAGEDLEQLAWYGRGPTENYWDRKAGTYIDLFESTVDAQYTPYVMPQENGNKTDVRWLALRNEAREGLLLSFKEPLECNVSHLWPRDLYGGYHINELKPCPETVITVDWHQRGVGSGCGIDTTPEYKIMAGFYTIAFRLTPFANLEMSEIVKLARRNAREMQKEDPERQKVPTL